MIKISFDWATFVEVDLIVCKIFLTLFSSGNSFEYNFLNSAMEKKFINIFY